MIERREKMIYTYEDYRPRMTEYFRELTEIQGDTYTEEQCRIWFDGIVNGVLEGNTEWLHIKDAQGNEVGQLLIGIAPNCHPDADYYIEEAFVEKAARRNGIMTKAASEFIKDHPGTYCYFVLTKNELAKAFWEKVFTDAGYAPVTLRDVGAGDDSVIQCGYAPKT